MTPVYFHGDEIEYTGKAERLHGAPCYEAALIEGHRKGETIWTYRAPNQAGENVCERHGANIEDHTLICGAPQCCPVCCEEAEGARK